jgi:hypothetical protein
MMGIDGIISSAKKVGAENTTFQERAALLD